MMLISGIILIGRKLGRRTSWVGMKFYGVKIWSNGVLGNGSIALIRLLPTQNGVWPLGSCQAKEHSKFILLVGNLLQASDQGVHWESFLEQCLPEYKRLYNLIGLVAYIIAC